MQGNSNLCWTAEGFSYFFGSYFKLTFNNIANKYVKWKPQTTKHASIIKQYDLIWEMVKTLAMCRSVYC